MDIFITLKIKKRKYQKNWKLTQIKFNQRKKGGRVIELPYPVN